MATLVIREGAGAGDEHPLEGEVVLGREQGSVDLALDDPGISRRHAAVRNLGGQITVQDLGSSNGTYANGERLNGDEEILLADGDEIQVGGIVISVHGADAATAIVPPTAAGAPDTSEHPGPAAAPPPPPPAQPPAQRSQPSATPGRLGPSPNQGDDNIPALAAFFLGPLSIFLILFSSGGAFFVALPCAIGAIVLGNMGMRRVDKGETSKHRALANIGRITGIIGTVLSVIAIVAVILVGALLDASEDNLSDLIDRIDEEIQGVDVPDVDTPDVPDGGSPDGGSGDFGGVEAP